MVSWILAAALALSAAAPATSPTPAMEAQVMALPPELQAQLRVSVLAGRLSPRERLNRLLHLMLDPQALGLVYDEDATFTVAQTVASRRANCLSFTLLFLALAREAGLDAYPREIRETLSWHQDGGILYRNDHIDAGVRIGGREYTVDTAWNSLIAVDSPVRVSTRRLLAHYYNNLAIQGMTSGSMPAALQDMATALDFDPGYAPHWSNAGILYLRNGDAAAAERAYAKALSLDPQDSGALLNMALLLQARGDRAGEAQFRERLARVQLNDPLHHYSLARELEGAGDYRQAIAEYQRAIQLHPGEHRFHAALANAYRLSGDLRLALRSLARARSLSTGASRAAYDAQIDALRNHAQP